MRSCSFFQLSIWRVRRRSFVSSSLSRIGGRRHADELERLVQLLQVIDQEVRPRPVDRLHLADDSFFKIKTSLPPAENFRNGRFALEDVEDGVPHRSLLQVNLAVAAR